MQSDLHQSPAHARFRILSLDGGGAKGFYTLGALKELEGSVGTALCDKFDLVYGTSTGAIIASLIGLGYRIDDIHALYTENVPKIVGASNPTERSKMLAELADKIFSDRTFEAMKTGVGVVTTRWTDERPMIFKSDLVQAHGRRGTFLPGFGCKLSEAIEASCSAYPFFRRKVLKTGDGETVELIDGGFSANNPTLYAIADAVAAIGEKPTDVRVVSLGVGTYPPPAPSIWMKLARKYVLTIELMEKTLETNTQSMEQLRTILFPNVSTVRINDAFERPEMATGFLEKDPSKLNILFHSGRQSFASRERQIDDILR